MPIPGRPNPNTRSQRAAISSQRRSQGTAQSQAWTPEQSGQAQSTAEGIFSRMRSGQGAPQQGNQMPQQSRTGQTGALGMLSERLDQGIKRKKKLGAGQQNAMAQRGIAQQMMAQRQQGI